MKFLKLAIAPLLLLSLVACGGETSSNESSQDKSETPSGELSEERTDWTFHEKSLMKNILHGNVVPYFSNPSGGTWVGYPKDPNHPNDDEYVISYNLQNGKKAHIEQMKKTLLSIGFQDESDPELEEMVYFILPLKGYETKHEYISCSPKLFKERQGNNVPFTFGAFFEYHADITKWDETKVRNACRDYLGVSIDIPSVPFEFTNMTIIGNHDMKKLGIGLTCNDPDSPRKYAEKILTLEADGWYVEENETNKGSYIVVDPNMYIWMDVFYSEPDGDCVLMMKQYNM